MVAPWKISEKDTIEKENFYTYNIDEKIKNRADYIAMFTSNDEAEEGKNGLKMYHKALGGEIINLKNHGHYCLKNMKTEEFPELLEVILK